MGGNIVYNFQMLCMSGAIAMVVYFFSAIICGRKHGWKGVLLYLLHWLYRFFFQETYYVFYLGERYGRENWYRNGYIFLQFVEMIFFVAVIHYVFQGSLVKVILSSFVLESMGSGIVVLCQTLLVGSISKDGLQGEPGHYVIKIICGLVMAAIVLWSVYHIFYRHLVKLQAYEIKHTEIFGGLILVEYLMALILNTNHEIRDRLSFREITDIIVINGICFSCGFLILSLSVYRQRKRKRQLLEKQIASMKNWERSINNQEELIFSQEAEIDEILCQMAILKSKDEKEERINLYIYHLKKQYEKIQAGIYSNNRKLDAFLLTLQKQCRQLNIEADIHFQGYQGVHLSEDILEELIWTIFQNVIPLKEPLEKNQMTLRAAEQGAYTILWLSLQDCTYSEKEWKAKKKKCQKQARIYLKPYHGIMTAEKNNQTAEIKVLLGKS